MKKPSAREASTRKSLNEEKSDANVEQDAALLLMADHRKVESLFEQY